MHALCCGFRLFSSFSFTFIFYFFYLYLFAPILYGRFPYSAILAILHSVSFFTGEKCIIGLTISLSRRLGTYVWCQVPCSRLSRRNTLASSSSSSSASFSSYFFFLPPRLARTSSAISRIRCSRKFPAIYIPAVLPPRRETREERFLFVLRYSLFFRPQLLLRSVGYNDSSLIRAGL